MTNELQEYNEVNEIMPVQDIKAQIMAVNDIMRSVMQDGVHFGKIPGCGDKPTLLKPGAEVLALAFKLDLQSESTILELPGGHREYRTVTAAYSKATGARLGNGEGCATTLESKWRYRAENTGALVPPEYWSNRDPALIGGSEFSTRKMDGKWFIFHKVEHDNPADYYNTCMKMAEKRSRTACCLNCTGASNLFTQDIEDMNLGQVSKPQTTTKPDVKKTQSKKESGVTSGKAGKLPTSEAMTKIDKVDELSGEKGGKPWTKYIIHSVGGSEYSTFSDTIGEDAKKIAGSDIEALILFEIHPKFGNQIVDKGFEIQN